MKNKRTKLTAILLSALMAVSTVSSVTWAAELFSDGNEEVEVAEEESNEIVSDVNEEPEAGDEVLMGLDSIDAADIKVTFKYDKTTQKDSTKVIAEFDVKGTKYNIEAVKGAGLFDNDNIIPASCLAPEQAIYSATLNINGDDYTVYSNQSEIAPTLGDLNKYSIDPNAVIKTGYIVVPGSKTLNDDGSVGHKVTTPKQGADGTITEGLVWNLDPAFCDAEGVKAYYSGCSTCKKYIPSNASATTTPGEVVKDSFFNGKIDVANGNFTFEDSSDSDTVNDIIAQKTEENAHVYDTEHPITLTDVGFEFKYGIQQSTYDASYGHEDDISIIANGVAYDFSGKSYGGYNYEDFVLENGDDVLQYAPLNSMVKNGAMQIADPDNGRDAYYYQVVKCKYCNTVKYFGKVIIKDVSNEIDGSYYEKADSGNIYGFFAKGRRDQCYLFSPVNTTIETKLNNVGITVLKNNGSNWDKIPVGLVGDTPDVLLEKCGKMGYYYIRSYEKDTPEAIYEELLEASSVTHVWGTTEVAGKDFVFTDGSKSETEDDLLLKAGDDTPKNAKSKLAKTTNDGSYVVVVRDGSGNVTEAKSKNCVTTAKYQLYHKCAICGVTAKVDGLKTAGPNPDVHDFPNWSGKIDEADSKYYQIEDEKEHDYYHTKYTYEYRTCNLCGKRELKLVDEVKEAHKLFETQFDDDFDKDGKDSTRVEPTCGKDGSYDVIQRCACRFEDDKTRKSTKIPATDQHDFTGSTPEIIIVGNVQVGGRTDKYGNPIKGEDISDVDGTNVYAQIVRKCNNCGEYDSNGINATVALPGKVGPEVFSQEEGSGRTFTDYVPAKVNPKTGDPYPCSVGSITVNFNWAGKVDGDPYTLSDKKVVSYYPNLRLFYGAKDHQPDDIRTENKQDATTEAPGQFDRVVYCSVCHEELSRETIPIAQIGSAPSIKAVPADYNTIDVSWDAVEGADHYRLYYKSSDVGVTTWKLVRTVNGTSFTHSGLVTGAKYRYTVRAVLNGVNGEYDRKGSVAIPKLAAPENVAVTAVSGKNKVSWSKVDGANGYIIQRSTGSGWTRVGSVKKGAKVTWIDKKPVSGATYRVRAYRTVNDANFSKNNVYSAFSAAK